MTEVVKFIKENPGVTVLLIVLLFLAIAGLVCMFSTTQGFENFDGTPTAASCIVYGHTHNPSGYIVPESKRGVMFPFVFPPTHRAEHDMTTGQQIAPRAGIEQLGGPSTTYGFVVYHLYGGLLERDGSFYNIDQRGSPPRSTVAYTQGRPGQNGVKVYILKPAHRNITMGTDPTSGIKYNIVVKRTLYGHRYNQLSEQYILLMDTNGNTCKQFDAFSNNRVATFIDTFDDVNIQPQFRQSESTIPEPTLPVTPPTGGPQRTLYLGYAPYRPFRAAAPGTEPSTNLKPKSYVMPWGSVKNRDYTLTNQTMIIPTKTGSAHQSGITLDYSVVGYGKVSYAVYCVEKKNGLYYLASAYRDNWLDYRDAAYSGPFLEVNVTYEKSSVDGQPLSPGDFTHGTNPERGRYGIVARRTLYGSGSAKVFSIDYLVLRDELGNKYFGYTDSPGSMTDRKSVV